MKLGDWGPVLGDGDGQGRSYGRDSESDGVVGVALGRLRYILSF